MLLRLSTMTSGRPPPDTTGLDWTRLGLDDDGTLARYFRPRSPCGASMSTARSLDLDDCLRTLPRRIPRTCRRPVGRARLGRRDLYYPHLLLVRVVYSLFPFSPSPPPPYSSSLFRSIPIQHQHHSPPIQSTASHTLISHVPSFISSHLLHSLSILPPLRSCLFSVWKNPHADKLFLSPLSSLYSPICNTHPYGLPLAPMCCVCWYGCMARWSTVDLSAPMVYFCAPAVPCILIRLNPTRART